MHRIVSLVVLVAILLLMGALFFRVIAGFLVPLFLALVLVVLFRPLFVWIERQCRGRTRVAAVLTTIVILLSVLIPLTVVLTVAGVELSGLLGDFGGEPLGVQVDELRKRFHLALPTPMQELDGAMWGLFRREVMEDPEVISTEVAKAEASLNALEARVADPEDELSDSQRRSLARLHGGLDRLASAAREGSGSHELSEIAAEVRDAYYLDLRPRLLQHYSPADETAFDRFHHWLILQANPSRDQLDNLRNQLRQTLGMESVGSVAVSTGTAVGKTLLRFVIGIIIMTIAVYYFLVDGPGMVDSLMQLSPLDRRHVSRLLGEFDKVSRAVVLATLLSALAQGVLGGIGYWLAGFESVFLLTVLTIVLAMIPFVGAAAVWVPCSLWLLLGEGRPLAASILAVYGVAVISAIDNLIKPYVLHGQSNLHPLLALLSVLGGVQVLGPIGIFVGPMAVAFLHALLHMLQGELRDIERPPFTPASAD